MATPLSFDFCNPLSVAVLAVFSGSSEMNSEVVVQEKIGGWGLLLYFIGPVVMAVGAVMSVAGNIIGGVIVLAIGVVLAVVLTAGCLIYNRRYRTVTDTGNGFHVSDAAGERTFDDSDVVALAYYLVPEFGNGVRSGDTRNFHVWVQQESKPIEMKNFLKGEIRDPLFELIDRLMDRQHDEAIDTLAAGGIISGVGWQLSAKGLKLDSLDEMVPVKEIAAIDRFEGKLCIWRSGEAEAFSRLALDARNVHLLSMVLGPWIEEREEEAGFEPTADGLGRILFKKEGSPGSVIALIVFGVLLLVVGCGILLLGEDVWFVGPLCWLGGIGCFAGAYGTSRSSFRCHEIGVYQRHWFGESNLKYIDIADFTNVTTRHYTNGAYTGTSINMTFAPKPGVEDAKKIQFNTSVRGSDDDLEVLRDHISKVIAGQMADDLSNHGSVPWTANTTFQKDGIEHRPVGFFGGAKEPIFIPWTEYSGYDIQQGVFYLFRKGATNSVAQEQVSAANFFPGFYLLLMLAHQDEEQEPEDEQV